MFTDRLRSEAGQLALPVIEVDTAMTEEGLAERVAEGFGLRALEAADDLGQLG
jgi:hypothetical protein